MSKLTKPRPLFGTLKIGKIKVSVLVSYIDIDNVVVLELSMNKTALVVETLVSEEIQLPFEWAFTRQAKIFYILQIFPKAYNATPA
jgi:hypothetical protein